MLDSPAHPIGEPNTQGRIAGLAPRMLEEGLDVRTALDAVRRRWLSLLIGSAVLPCLALIALSRMEPLYTATGSLIFGASEYKDRGLQSILRADPITEAVMASQAEVLHGLHIAQKVAEWGNLYSNPEFNRRLRPPSVPTKLWRALAGADEAGPAPAAPGMGPTPGAERDAVMRAVQAALHAAPVRASHVLEVTFTARDPLIAATAVNNAMDVYIKDQYAAKYRAVRSATELLEKRATELRAEVRRAEDEIAAYRARNAVSQGMHAGLDAEQISHLTEDLVRARGDLANADARLDAARGRAGAAAQAAISSSVTQSRLQQDQLAAQLQARQAHQGANHPEVEALRRQLAESQRGVASEIGRVVAAVEAERRAAAGRVVALESNLDDARREANRVAQTQIPLNALQRDADAARDQLRATLERIQQTAQQAALEAPDAHEISQALPPEFPSYPRTVPWMAGAIAAGPLLGLLLVYLLERASTAARSTGDIRAVTGLPCFALLPEVSRRARGRYSLEDYAASQPLTLFAEQIRCVRAGLWLGPRRPRVIAITAARPAEGKSVLTLALGQSARRAGARVIAVECDLRQPCFAARLGDTHRTGLADLLGGDAALADVIRQDGAGGMDYILAGRPGGDTLSLFTSGAMERLLHTLRDHYDLILLDAPPVRAASEARVIAATADAAVLCVRWGSTPRAVIRQALDMLDEAGAAIVGTVLTRVDTGAHRRSGHADADMYHRAYRAYRGG